MRETQRQLALLVASLLGVSASLAALTWLGTGRVWCPFLDPANLLGIVRQSAPTVVLAVGMTFVIVAGGIDLSVGSLVALGSVAIATALSHAAPTWLALVAGIGACAGCGMLSGIVTVRGGVPPFISTLGMYLAARSLAFIICGGKTLYGGSATPGVRALPVALPVLAVGAAWLVLARTRFGRAVYAVGGNLEAARLSGIAIDRARVVTFTISGVASGLAAIIYWARTQTGSHLAGGGAELDAIAAVVIGGTSIAGGEGHVIGSLLGALLMTVLRNGLVLAGLSDEHQKLVMGIVIVGAVLLDRVRARRACAA